MHQSYGEGAERHIIVWKPSRSRKSLKTSMVLDASAGDTLSVDTPTHGRAADQACTAGQGAPSAGQRTEGTSLDSMSGHEAEPGAAIGVGAGRSGNAPAAKRQVVCSPSSGQVGVASIMQDSEQGGTRNVAVDAGGACEGEGELQESNVLYF